MVKCEFAKDKLKWHFWKVGFLEVSILLNSVELLHDLCIVFAE